MIIFFDGSGQCIGHVRTRAEYKTLAIAVAIAGIVWTEKSVMGGLR